MTFSWLDPCTSAPFPVSSLLCTRENPDPSTFSGYPLSQISSSVKERIIFPVGINGSREFPGFSQNLKPHLQMKTWGPKHMKLCS